MLALVTFFLIALVFSTIAIWLYRLISSWKGFDRITVGASAIHKKGWLKAQPGFSSTASSTRDKAKSVALNNAGGSIKVPWGW